MKKKIIGLLLTVTLLLTGCGNKAEETDLTVSGQESREITEETRETGSEDESTDETQESTKPTETDLAKSDESTKNSSEPAGKTEVKGSSQSESDTAAKNTSASKSSQESKSKTENSQAGNKPSAESSQAGSKPSTESSKGSTKPSAGGGTGNGGTTSTPKPSHTTCIWDGGKVTSAASCNSDGVKTYTCTVCGKTKTEGIAKTAHNYVSETTPPTCTEAGRIKTTCSICGSVQSEKAGAAATGHKMADSWFGDPPTCSKGGYLNRYCTVCDFLETSTNVPPLAHMVVDTEIQHGNCNTYTVIRHTCSSCGVQVKEDTAYKETNDHSWEWGQTGPEWSEEAGDFVTRPFERCSRCGIPK